MGKDKRDKKEKKDTKDKPGKKKAKKGGESAGDGIVLSEILALQSQLRRIEYLVISRYVTRRENFAYLEAMLEENVLRLYKDVLKGCRSDANCGPGFYCCNGYCQPNPCGVGQDVTPVRVEEDEPPA